MSYKKQDWASKTVVTKSGLINMDDQIALNEQAAEENATEITKIKTGSVPAGNSNKLGGHPASDFVTTATMTALEDEVDRHAFGEQSGSRNLWDEQWEIANNIDDSTGKKVAGNTRIISKNYVPVSPNTNYNFTTSASNMYAYEYDSARSFLRRTQLNGDYNVAKKSVTTGDNTKYILFKFVAAYGLVYLHDTAIIEGTSGQYEPYIASNAMLTDEVNGTKSMISDEWDGTKTYAVGSYAIYQNALYKCLIQNSGQNPSTSPTYWKMVKVTDIVGSGGGTETFAPTTDWELVMDRAGQSYVVPSNGWIRAFLGTSSATPSTSLVVNGNVAIQASYYFGVNTTGLVRVANGDVITVTGGSNNVLFCEQN